MAKTMKKSEISPFLEKLHKAFETQLNALGPVYKKKTKEDIIAGFKDGARSALNILRQDGYLDVDSSEATTAPAASEK